MIYFSIHRPRINISLECQMTLKSSMFFSRHILEMKSFNDHLTTATKKNVRYFRVQSILFHEKFPFVSLIKIAFFNKLFLQPFFIFRILSLTISALCQNQIQSQNDEFCIEIACGRSTFFYSCLFEFFFVLQNNKYAITVKHRDL